MKTLLVVDMQNGFITSDNHKLLVKKINKLVAGEKYDNIIFTKYMNNEKKNSLYQDKIGWNGLKTKAEQELAIVVPNNAKIFEKYGYGLQLQDLKYIKALKTKEIDICGVKAEACVYAIALQLWDMGIYPNVLINFVEGDMKETMKDVYIKQFGDVDSNNKET